MKIYIILAFLIVCLFHQSGQAQCSFGVAATTTNSTSYAKVTGQSFTANCAGVLQNITFILSGSQIDDVRNSGFFISARVKNASGSILGNATFSGSATKTDQWYNGATVVANFSNANILLQSGSVYTFELVETSNTIELILFNTTSSSVYSGGNYIADGVQKTNQDLTGWTVNVQAAPTPPTTTPSSFYVSAGGIVTTRGSSVITLSNTKFANDGTFTGTSGTVQIIGGNSNANTTIEGTGTTTFNNLTINKSSNNAQLNQNVAVTGNLTLTSGGVMLNSGNINFGSTGSLQNETETNRVFGTGGYLQTTVNLNAPNATNPANLGAMITSTANLGSTLIKRAHSSFTLNGNGINRSFDITPTNNTGLNATLKFNYLDAELNGNSEANLALWKSTNAGTNWTALVSTNNATSNFVQSTGIPSFALFSVGTNAVVNTPNPPTNVTANSTSICSGSSVSLSGACNSGTLTWYNVSSGGTAIGTASPLSQSPTTNITYYAACNDGVNESGRVGTGLITVNAPIVLGGSNTNVLCNGGSTGSATVTVSNGTTPYTYLWSNGGTTATISNLMAGIYSVTVTDANSCSAMKSFTITQSAPIVLGGSQVNVLCNGSATGSATVTVSNGTTPYTYLWSNGGTTATISNLMAGIYNVTVTDANGCSAMKSFTITQSAPIVLGGSQVNVLCNGSATGSATVTVSNGTTPYTYLWSNGGTTATISNLMAGIYSVTVTDANGCSAMKSFTITESALLTATTSSNSPICAGNTINLLSGIQGNTPSLTAYETYAWTGVNSFSSTLQNPSIVSATTLASGTYQVTVTNANGCTATATTSVKVNALPTATASSNSPICAGTSLNLSSSGGISYAWTGVNSFSSSLQNPSILSATTLASGTYQVTITNANGCTASVTTTVIVNALPTATASSNSPICAGNTINLLGGIQGNSQSLVSTETYSWTGVNSFSSTLQNPSIVSATTLASGTYQVTVTNANGCTALATTSVKVNALPTATASSNSPICAGTSLNLSSSGGTSYAWTGVNSFSSSLQNPSILSATTLASGTYQVTVTNANGCTASATTTVIVNALPTAMASSNSPICAGNTINLLGGIQGNTPSLTASETYAWTGVNSFSSTLQNPSIVSATTLASGTYQVTVTNSNGCTALATTSVIVNALPTATASSNSPICAGTSLSLSSSGGISYAWTGVNSFSSSLQNPSILSATILASGTYQVIVTNANGCTAVATTLVTVNSTPVTPTTQADTQIIFGGGTSLTATGCEGTLKWYQTTDNMLVIMPVSPMVTTQYYAKCEVTAHGITCVSEKSNSITVTVLMPTPPVATGATTCVEAAVTLTATGCSGSIGTFTLKWYQKSDSTLVSMPISPSVSSEYFAKCEQSFNGVTAISNQSNVVTVTVLSPNIPVATGATIYKGDQITLSSTGCTGEGFVLKWYETNTNNLVAMPISPNSTTQYYAKCEQTANSVTCFSTKSSDITVMVVNRIFVDITKITAPVQDGNTWMTAYGDLQTVLATASAGVEVWVAKGTYKTTTTIDRTIYFNIPNNVILYGGFAGTENALSERNFRTNISILSGEIGNQGSITDNSYHVVVFNGSSSATVLNGFTILGGNANFNPNLSLVPLTGPPTPVAIEAGGGIVVKNGGSPSIINCIIMKNSAITGGGLYAGEASTPTINACSFLGNQATFGSGIYLQDNSHANINNTLLTGNRGVGSLYNNSSNPRVTNCTLSGNGGYSGGIFNTLSQPVVKNSIIWGNAKPFNDKQSMITNSIVEGGYAGLGNLNYDPQFVTPIPEGISPTINGDYTLKANSFGIDRGENGSISLTDLDLGGNLRRYTGGRVDMGAYEFQGNVTVSLVISITTGDWNAVSTWDIARIPQLGDTVIIDQNHVVTLNSEGSAKNIEYRGTGTLKLNSTNSKLNLGF